MRFNIELFPSGLENLAIIVNLDEKIDWSCKFLTARDDAGHLLGVAGVNFEKESYPRFEHIIVSPKYQKGKLAAVLMRRMEDWLKSLRFYHYVSFIYHERILMHHYAKKWKMVSFMNRPKGIWYYKTITGG